jgi:hypothetical protein
MGIWIISVVQHERVIKNATGIVTRKKSPTNLQLLSNGTVFQVSNGNHLGATLLFVRRLVTAETGSAMVTEGSPDVEAGVEAAFHTCFRGFRTHCLLMYDVLIFSFLGF